MFTSIEICAGAGGQALGLEQAGFEPIALVEYEKEYCDCLKLNRPNWNVMCMDVHSFDGKPYCGKVDLLAGGVPCPPFSIAGKQLGASDERDLFPEMLRLVSEIRPRLVMIENVKGLLSPKFDTYRNSILCQLRGLEYSVHIKLLNASEYGVPQLRPRVVIIGVSKSMEDTFSYPVANGESKQTVGDVLYDLMASKGWEKAEQWRDKAASVAPTIVGGSKKHGGPDLGPTRARQVWAGMGINGNGVADEAPAKDFEGMPKLTPRMIARIQGFPDEWDFGNKKTRVCRMIGNAFPPPVAKAVGQQLIKVLEHGINNSQSA